MIGLSINGYKYCNLEDVEVDKIKELEHMLNNNRNDDDKIILLAFNDKE